MLTPDVNVLVDSFREDSPYHREVAAWFRDALASPEPMALLEIVLSGFLRVVTHPRIFDPPASVGEALAFTDALLAHPQCVVVRPGDRHWQVFAGLCRETDARGNLIADAYLASLAIEAGCTLVTSDRDFSRFPSLRWRPPSEVQ